MVERVLSVDDLEATEHGLTGERRLSDVDGLSSLSGMCNAVRSSFPRVLLESALPRPLSVRLPPEE